MMNTAGKPLRHHHWATNLPAKYVGRVGGLAVALGVGAVLYGVPFATHADPGSQDSVQSVHPRPAQAADAARSRSVPHPHPPGSAAPGPNAVPPAAARVGISSAISHRAARRATTTEQRDTASPDAAKRVAALGVAPREFAGASKTPATSPISVAPVETRLTDGILSGTVAAADARGYPVVYTVTRSPNLGGKVTLDGDTGTFAYLPDYNVLTSGATEKFGVVVSEETPLVAALDRLANGVDSALRDTLRAALAALQQMPIVNFLLRPIIGSAHAVTVSIDNGQLVPSPFTTPVANTVHVISFDGTPISTNFFPAVGLQAGQTAPAIFTTAGLSSPGMTDPYGRWDRSVGDRPGLSGYATPGIAPLREAGYNVITWDSRGKGASGGRLEMAAPEFEGRDTQNLITYYTNQGWLKTDGSGDPYIGMVGGSYGGLTQLVAAAVDHRIDAIVPAIAPNSLSNSLYPSKAFNALWLGALLPFAMLSAGNRVNPQIYLAAITGDLFGWVSPTFQALMKRTGPSELVKNITAPALFIQGVPDTAFPLGEGLRGAQTLSTEGIPVKMIWYCGGHGVCLNPKSPIQDQVILDSTLGWLNRYVKDVDTQEFPTFQWVDQSGQFHGSDLMPFDPGFTGDPIVASSRGGFLPIVSVLGGGGPGVKALPSPALVSDRAVNAINLKVTAPQGASATLIVGRPELTLTYSGIGLSHNVFAQFVDDRTGLVLGNAVTPVPVVLDGRTHTATVMLDAVAHTMTPGSSITLQLTSSALPFVNSLALGAVNVSGITVSLPTVADGMAGPLVTP